VLIIALQRHREDQRADRAGASAAIERAGRGSRPALVGWISRTAIESRTV